MLRWHSYEPYPQAPVPQVPLARSLVTPGPEQRCYIARPLIHSWYALKGSVCVCEREWAGCRPATLREEGRKSCDSLPA